MIMQKRFPICQIPHRCRDFKKIFLIMLVVVATGCRSSESDDPEDIPMDDQIPSASTKAWDPIPSVREIAVARARESTRFTAALILTAWEMSSEIRIPGWVDRASADQGDYR